eukprot:CAMPEP_0194133530 /NCGR_PEP_ID=MMETSP0152-20130528/3665_1 /TAXON_ID=1049557 /ORGANISM="Thalassiothrix antarctica, Strain L6-D1" /LENGTH=77 /DNA_ID=CAMNT_0038828857 /DNA_START=172 /DNA_END=402 /DNA_ORIENTATION=+
MKLPLLITFVDTCDTACQLETMQKASIDENNFDHLTSLGIITLKEATDEQLEALKEETESVKTIECDGEVSTNDDFW